MTNRTKISAILNNRYTGLVGVSLLGLLLLVVFYGSIIRSLNSTLFSAEGDGIQSYYNTYYLAKYDSSLLYSYSMNYPYGEVSFYTLSQPLIAGPLKFISDNFVDVTPFTVGILNFIMLASVVLGAVFLYLLLAETGISAFPAASISAGIAFLSPQIDRFGGHFTLSYVCALPLLLYLLLLFHKRKKKLIYSFLIGAVVFALMTGMVYYAAFFAIVVLFYWISFISDRNSRSSMPYVRVLLHIGLQLIIPVLVFYLLTSQFSHLSPDKPSKPYGFLVYRATPASVLLPLWVDYGRFLHKIWNFNDVQWEGIAYVGITATAGFMVIIAGILVKLFRRNWKVILQVTDNVYLNVLFWASLAALLYSFGIPFILKLQFLVDYLGPLQQIRSIGRFSWLFYYVINVVVFYRIWCWYRSAGNRYVRTIGLFLCLAFLYADVYFYLKHRQYLLDNKFPVWSDVSNSNPDNRWVKQIEPEKYQAILPLPFYHMGSDNYYIHPRCNMMAHSFQVSMKTGLPISAIYLSRASISQSLKSVALVMEPYRDLRILNDLPNRKPFLVVAARCREYTAEEENLLQLAVKVDSNSSFILYRLECDSLSAIRERTSAAMVREVAGLPVKTRDRIYVNGKADVVTYLDFDTTGTAQGYRGNALQISGRSVSVLFDNMIPAGNDYGYVVSFWFSPVDLDLYPKTRMEIFLSEDTGVTYEYKSEMVGKLLKTVDGSWGLIEWRIQPTKPQSRARIAVFNTQISKGNTYYIDEFMIRPENCSVYQVGDNYISKNTRYYYPSDNAKTAISDVPRR